MANTCGNTHPDVDVDVAVAVTVAFAAYISRKINALQFARFICRRRQQGGGRGVEGRKTAKCSSLRFRLAHICVDFNTAFHNTTCSKQSCCDNTQRGRKNEREGEGQRAADATASRWHFCI